LIVPPAGHWSAPERRCTRTVCHVSEIVECRSPRFRTSLESSPNAKLLPTVHSVIAGSVDAISFLGLGGLFIAHVTGNLVIFAAHLAGGACHVDAVGSGNGGQDDQRHAFHLCRRRGVACRAADVAKARDRAVRAWPAIVGFAVGCGLGATLEAAIGLRSPALPAGLAFLAVAMGMTGDLEGGHGP
jgi:hypothetical protein